MKEHEELKKVFFRLGEKLKEAPLELQFEIIDYMLKIYKAIYPEGEKDAARKLNEGIDKANEKASRLVSLLREAETIISSLSKRSESQHVSTDEVLKTLVDGFVDKVGNVR